MSGSSQFNDLVPASTPDVVEERPIRVASLADSYLAVMVTGVIIKHVTGTTTAPTLQQKATFPRNITPTHVSSSPTTIEKITVRLRTKQPRKIPQPSMYKNPNNYERQRSGKKEEGKEVTQRAVIAGATARAQRHR